MNVDIINITISNEFTIGELITTEAYGLVKIVDIFVSTTNPSYFCYRAETRSNDPSHITNSFLCNEEELISDHTHTSSGESPQP